MISILVNGLSATHMSAKHVLLGHLRQLTGHCDIALIVPDSQWDEGLNDPAWKIIRAPKSADHWLGRSIWEWKNIPPIIKRAGYQLFFTFNGMIQRNVRIPQLTLAQNPWCMTSSIPKTLLEGLKALLQRRAYRYSQTRSVYMAYNSHFMQQLYRKNANCTERRGIVAYQGIDDTRFDIAASHQDAKRDPLQIVSVSAMACWKGAERLVSAIGLLHNRSIPAKLRLVGPWPDSRYESLVRQTIIKHNLSNHVTITGKVSNEQLNQEFATARVYALLSQCESFGIPAVEAQAFGTPVVGTNSTAMAEVGGSGGIFVDAFDIEAAADAIQSLLTDDNKWESMSLSAKQNANRFRWKNCSQPLIELIRSMQEIPLRG